MARNRDGTDLLRVMISKSANFTFSVTVRPREPLSSQCRQTLSISGCSSATIASNSVRSLENVFSAPTDLRIRLARTVAVVDAARDPVVVAAGLAEVRLHEVERLVAHVEAGAEPERVHLRARRRPDAVEFADRQRFDERWPHFRRDDELAVRLAVVGGELRQELVVGDAGGGVEAGHFLDLRADRERDVARQRDALQVFGDVKIGFVERQRLDDRRVLGEDLADLLRDRLVDLEARLDEDQVRALPLARSPMAWPTWTPNFAGFVAGCRHDAALAGSADGDRLAAEIRIVPLLDRRVEGVHVDVDDLALAAFVHCTLVKSPAVRMSMVDPGTEILLRSTQ